MDRFLDVMGHVLSPPPEQAHREGAHRRVRFLVSTNSPAVLQALRQRFAPLLQHEPGKLLLIQVGAGCPCLCWWGKGP